MKIKILEDGTTWCPKCNENVQLLSMRKAIKAADSSRRSLYRYIQSGQVMRFKLAGNSTRICANCLIQPTWDPNE